MTDIPREFTERPDGYTGIIMLEPIDHESDCYVSVETAIQRRWPIEIPHVLMNAAEARVMATMLIRAAEIAEASK